MSKSYDTNKTKELSEYLTTLFEKNNFAKASSAKFEISSKVMKLVTEGADPSIEIEAKKDGHKYDIATLMDKIGAVKTAKFCREKVSNPENTEQSKPNKEPRIVIEPKSYNTKLTGELMTLMGSHNHGLEANLMSNKEIEDIRKKITDLIDRGANPNALVNGAGKDRVPHFLARMGAVDTIKYLKDKYPEMDFNIKGDRGNTPLHIALTSEFNLSEKRLEGHMDRLLGAIISPGAGIQENSNKVDIKATNDKGDTPKAAFYRPLREFNMRKLDIDYKKPLSADQEASINKEVSIDLKSSAPHDQAAKAIFKHIDSASTENNSQIKTEQLKVVYNLLKNIPLIECNNASKHYNLKIIGNAQNTGSSIHQCI